MLSKSTGWARSGGVLFAVIIFILSQSASLYATACGDTAKGTIHTCCSSMASEEASSCPSDCCTFHPSSTPDKTAINQETRTNPAKEGILLPNPSFAANFSFKRLSVDRMVPIDASPPTHPLVLRI